MSASLVLFCFMIVAAWAWGVMWLANGRFGAAPGTTYRTTLLNKWVHHGKSTSWHLRLAP